jgi:hypothetical protein
MMQRKLQNRGLKTQEQHPMLELEEVQKEKNFLMKINKRKLIKLFSNHRKFFNNMKGMETKRTC